MDAEMPMAQVGKVNMICIEVGQSRTFLTFTLRGSLAFQLEGGLLLILYDYLELI
jgi:hypothetical protein